MMCVEPHLLGGGGGGGGGGSQCHPSPSPHIKFCIPENEPYLPAAWASNERRRAESD